MSNYIQVAPWIAANDTGFLIVWCDVSPGATAGRLLGIFSNDNGADWSDPASIINNTTNANGPPTVIGTNSGFLVTWWQTDNSIQSSFSSDGTSWSSAQTINLDNINYPLAPPLATGIGDTFYGCLAKRDWKRLF